MKFRFIHKYIWVFLIFVLILTGCNKFENENASSNSNTINIEIENPDVEINNIESTDTKITDTNSTNINRTDTDSTYTNSADTNCTDAKEIATNDVDNTLYNLYDNEKDTQQDINPEENNIIDDTKDNKLTLVMVGDVLLHTKINESGKMEDGSYNYDHLFANVREDIQGADLAIVNQEVILGGRELGLSGYPTFNGAYEIGDALAKAGFDVILHATNHTLDKGKRGVLNCLNFWKSTYPEIGVVGINESQEAQNNNIYIYKKDGIKVAVLNYTYGTNGIKLPSDMPYIVNLLDKRLIKAHVQKAKELADFIIVAPHWGTEYQLTPSKNQRELALYMADLGVDLVIGTHPHVIQPVEWIESSNGNRMLVFYSIGNFINSTSGTGKGVANRMVGAMAQVTLARNEDGKVYIEEYGAEPLVTHVKTGPGLITTYKFMDYSEELASENEIIKQDSNFTFKYCIDLWNKVYADEFALEY